MKRQIAIPFLFAMILASCKKFVTADPPKNQIIGSTVFTDDVTAISAIKGIFNKMSSGGEFAAGGIKSVTHLAGLSADDYYNFEPAFDFYFANSLSATTVGTNLWSIPYLLINNTNAAIDGLTNSTSVTSTVKNELLGEAKFIRAFCYFYLVNLFGDVPLILSTDYKINAIAPRTPQDQVYQQIVADLKEAQSLLSDSYSFTNEERVEPNKWAAKALLARVYLFLNDWTNAEAESTAVIDNSGLYSLNSDLNSVFLMNSEEAIWQLLPEGGIVNWTHEGSMFIPTGIPMHVSLSDQLLHSFESGDFRRANWVDSIIVDSTTYYYPYKYKVMSATSLTEYSMVLRLAEQYLIRAEARAQQENISGSQNDLNIIRNRAGLANTIATDKTSLLSAILHERQVELFSEWGHRWLDLKRTKNIDAVMGVMTPQKGGSWKTEWQLYPIPQSEILNDQNLTQNAGY